MMGRQHALTGVVAGLGACSAFQLDLRTGAVVTTGMVVGTLAPDLDAYRSIATRALSPLSWIGLVRKPLVARLVRRTSSWAYHATRAPRDPQECAGTHRYLTHAPVVSALLGGLLALVLALTPAASWWYVGAALGIGGLVHIAGDWLTPTGVPLVWPLVHRGKRWWFFRSPWPFAAGGKVELQGAAPIFAATIAGQSCDIARLPAAAFISVVTVTYFAALYYGHELWKRSQRPKRRKGQRLAEIQPSYG